MPFRYQGQYYDSGIDLCYNRFRYYDCNTGIYISQDPIGLLGGLSFYVYVHDVNSWIDPLGLTPWEKGKFAEWFDSATEQDVLNNKTSVSQALRGMGGMHEKFPVSIAHKSRELDFLYDELMEMTIPTDKVYFENVSDKYGKTHSGPHSTGKKLSFGVSSKASYWFHNDLIEKLKAAKTKSEALAIIEEHHKKYVKDYH